MNNKPQTVLHFEVKSNGDPLELLSKYHPQGKTILNRTEWRGREPRSCGITDVSINPYQHGSSEPKVIKIEVTYRPKGCITFVGGTKYDAWTAMMLNRTHDGTLLDRNGNPLAEGLPPVYLPFEVYRDVEFNELDFGELIEEVEVRDIEHVTYEQVLKQIETSPRFSASITSTFMAPRRFRPPVKIVLSDHPSGTTTDSFGTRIVNINRFTPQLQQVLLDELTELVMGFVEGRLSMSNLSNDTFVFAELSDIFVDCTANEEGGESRFDCLHEYLPETYLDELATRLRATYQVKVSVVDGPKCGLVLQHLKPEKA